MQRVLILLLALSCVHMNAQDLGHYKRVVKELSSAQHLPGERERRRLPLLPHHLRQLAARRLRPLRPVFNLVTDFIGQYSL